MHGTTSSWPRPGPQASSPGWCSSASPSTCRRSSPTRAPDPSSGLAGRAGEALILLVAVLMASVLVLVPGQGLGVLGVEVLVVGLVTWGWIVAIQLPQIGRAS